MSLNTHTAASPKRPRRFLPACLALAIGSLLAAALASPALAAREYDSQILTGGAASPQGVVVDPSDHVWIIAPENPSVLKYDPYPSQTLESTLTTTALDGGNRGWGERSLAVDAANGDLYAANFVNFEIGVYDPVNFVTLLSEIGGGRTYPHLNVVADNSAASPAYGDLYIGYGGQSFGIVKRLDASRNPAPFSASSEPYIEGNEITGTPSGAFGAITSVAVAEEGNIYVLDSGTEFQYEGHNVIDEFRPSGEFVRQFSGAHGPGGRNLNAVAVDPNTGNVLVIDDGEAVINEFSSSGEFLGQTSGAETPAGVFRFTDLEEENGGSLAFNSEGYLYVADTFNYVVDIFKPLPIPPKVAYEPPSNTTPTSAILNAEVGPGRGAAVEECQVEYGEAEGDYALGSLPCLNAAEEPIGTPSKPIEAPTRIHVAVSGLTTATTYHYRLAVKNQYPTHHAEDRTFTPVSVQELKTEAATDVTAGAASLNGSYLGLGEDTHYYFQYGTDDHYGLTTEVKDNGSATGHQSIAPITVEGLQPHSTYHYRIVATNSRGTTYGSDESLTTEQPPAVDSFSSSGLSETGADLNAEINPEGSETTYHFEYGTTTNYGTSAPAPEAHIGDSTTDQSVGVHLEGLQPHVPYHFRLTATNGWGATTTRDLTFEFFPPNCPNSHLRQQTGTSYLPDCRAYELVSPANAGGATLFPVGPNSPQATSPSRLAFGANLGQIPGLSQAPNVWGDLYVSTRTPSGWVTHYVGLPGSANVGTDNGPPGELADDQLFGLESPAGVLTDTAMDKFMNWDDSGYGEGFSGEGSLISAEETGRASYAPYIWDAEGNSLGRLPTDLGPQPAAERGERLNGATKPSPDFSHYFFSSGPSQGEPRPEPELPAREAIKFTPEGLTAAPGSAYDDNLANHTVTLVSKLGGTEGNIPQNPADAADPNEYITFPGVSTDGSHILMSTQTTPTCFKLCEPNSAPAQRALFMRVNDAVTYDVSESQLTHEPADVNYVGISADGSEVYFTTAQRLTSEDTDESTDLYMWSEKGAEEGHPLTDVSLGDNGNGNSDECLASWVTKCGVEPILTGSGFRIPDSANRNGPGGNGLSDNAIAAQNGDIYFFSPQQLDGVKGVNGQRNLYDYREGHLHYVTTITGGPFCFKNVFGPACSAGPLIRIQVSPNDTHMAFLTASRITSYENAGYLEMYTYEPASGKIVCVSCDPSGAPPTSNAEASLNGIFMADDGRTFFSTADPLIPQDTDGLRDVYEYTEGRPQLISSGTSAKALGFTGIGPEKLFESGLIGVSANGTNAYFSTYDSLVGQDENGSLLKFYDARTDGGFPFVPPPAPCAAADECAGPGSSPPSAPHKGTAAGLGTGGNVHPQAKPRHRRAKKHRRAAQSRGADKHRRGAAQ